MKTRSDPKPVRLRIRGADELAFLGAAYLTTEQAYARVGRLRKDWTVALQPKTARPGGARLAALFRRNYEGQLLRWRLARANKDIRAAVLRRALSLSARETGASPRREQSLSPEQKREIASLLAEAEADKSAKDPLGIMDYWEDGREGRA